MDLLYRDTVLLLASLMLQALYITYNPLSKYFNKCIPTDIVKINRSYY